MDNLNLCSSSSYDNNLGKLIKKSDLFKHLGVVAKILMGFFNLSLQMVEYYLEMAHSIFFSSPFQFTEKVVVGVIFYMCVWFESWPLYCLC